MGSTETMVMNKKTQHQTPEKSPKCPRCDSSNTKFCYYNNYSLSQPRHFCKACKRYWTHGGILRSVPVGGGCRKNKKIKRSISAIDQALPSSTSPAATSSNPNTTPAQNIPVHNPVFLGLPTNPSYEIGTLPSPSFDHRVSSVDSDLGFDFQPQMNGFGLGLSNNNGNYQNGSSNPLLSSYSLFGSSTNSPTIASLLGSSLSQQKIINNINVGSQGLGSFEEVQIRKNMSLKMKREGGENCQIPSFQSDLEQMNTSDPTLYWNATNFGTWLDSSNLGKSYHKGGEKRKVLKHQYEKFLDRTIMSAAKNISSFK